MLNLENKPRLPAGDVSTTPHPHSDSSVSVDDLRQCGVSYASLAQIEQEAPFSREREIFRSGLRITKCRSNPIFLLASSLFHPDPLAMDDDNSQPPVTTLDRSARQWGLREWGFRWDEAGAVSTSSHPTAIRGGSLPFGWRFAQKCCVLEMHAIFTSEPGRADAHMI
ncbi:hypothetical protein DFH08DRAFT_802439 [Mycena albidolilacea]|uniref:Uncharacterized protein n=1 Tax=Mycena albidolilacea TaxID=1033008 RepID=A0AAD7EY96_9AGAR|nr:hypothetical protein DFH08DRAFT_810499 [Mycena albidolilacea]KAJ7358628.1 hypothetical protein DFH08DRAFT_802439 [Mycena albidolilacea]